jgi:hypothetical protein
VVPTVSDDVDAVPIGSLGDGAKRGSLGAQHLGSKLLSGGGRSGDSRPARTVARNRISEAIRPPLAHGDKLTVGGTESDGLGARFMRGHPAQQPVLDKPPDVSFQAHSDHSPSASERSGSSSGAHAAFCWPLQPS